MPWGLDVVTFPKLVLRVPGNERVCIGVGFGGQRRPDLMITLERDR